MGRRAGVHVLASKRELRALTSPARQELVDVLQQIGAASVSELGHILARPADALYYHLRVLERAGLVVESTERTPSGKKRATFRLVAERLYLDYRAGRQADPAAVPAIVNGMLRLGMRDFRTAAADPKTVVSGPRRELWAARRMLWMSSEDVAKVNRLIESFGGKSKRRPRGRLFALTIVLVPLRRSARQRG